MAKARCCIALLLASAFLGEARSFDFQSLHSARGFTWLSQRSDAFDLYFEPGSTAQREIEHIQQTMEKSRRHAETLLGGTSALRTAVFLLESRARMKELTGEESNGLAANGVQAIVYSETIKALGAHETCHILARELWGAPHGSWIAEGLAVYSDDMWWELPLHSVARGLLDRQRLAPMSELVKSGWNKKYHDTVTYPELGSFVKFVYEHHGRDAVKEMYQHGAPKTLGDLEKEWLQEIGKAEPKFPKYQKAS